MSGSSPIAVPLRAAVPRWPSHSSRKGGVRCRSRTAERRATQTSTSACGNLPPGEQAAPPAVEVRGISKDFGSNRALDRVDLRIGDGEVVGLLGQNGSGKSTLVKVLAGVYDPEPGGHLFVGGEEVALPLAPGQASEIGLSFVYQNLALAARAERPGEPDARPAHRRRPELVGADQLDRGAPDRRGRARPLRRQARSRPADGRTGTGRPGAAGDRPGRGRPPPVPHAQRLQALGARPRRADRVPARGGSRPALRPHQDRRGRGGGGAVHLARPGRGPRDHRPGRRAAGRPGRRRGGNRRHPRGAAGRSHRRGAGPPGREHPGGYGPGRRPSKRSS